MFKTAQPTALVGARFGGHVRLLDTGCRAPKGDPGATGLVVFGVRRDA
jgi:hypothetical protein